MIFSSPSKKGQDTMSDIAEFRAARRERVLKLMTQRGLSREEFIEAVGVHEGRLKAALDGDAPLSLPQLAAIAETFKVNLTWLRTGTHSHSDAAVISRVTPELDPRGPLTPAQVRHLAALIAAADASDRVKWSLDGETVREGTVRRIGPYDGTSGARENSNDVRDHHVHITTDLGAEVWVPVSLAVRLMGEGSFALRRHSPAAVA